jgi:hypothetical protein
MAFAICCGWISLLPGVPRARSSSSLEPWLAGEYVRSALDENHLAAKATNGLRHLYADRPTSEHEQPAGTSRSARIA